MQRIDDLDQRVAGGQRELRRLGADHPCVPWLLTAPGIAWVLGSTIAAEVGDVGRFPSPKKLCGSTGLCPRVYQSGDRDHRGPLAARVEVACKLAEAIWYMLTRQPPFVPARPPQGSGRLTTPI